MIILGYVCRFIFIFYFLFVFCLNCWVKGKVILFLLEILIVYVRSLVLIVVVFLFVIIYVFIFDKVIFFLWLGEQNFLCYEKGQDFLILWGWLEVGEEFESFLVCLLCCFFWQIVQILKQLGFQLVELGKNLQFFFCCCWQRFFYFGIVFL